VPVLVPDVPRVEAAVTADPDRPTARQLAQAKAKERRARQMEQLAEMERQLQTESYKQHDYGAVGDVAQQEQPLTYEMLAHENQALRAALVEAHQQPALLPTARGAFDANAILKFVHGNAAKHFSQTFPEVVDAPSLAALVATDPVRGEECSRMLSELNQHLMVITAGVQADHATYQETYTRWVQGQLADFEGWLALFPRGSCRLGRNSRRRSSLS
jgi:hypothetical protein